MLRSGKKLLLAEKIGLTGRRNTKIRSNMMFFNLLKVRIIMKELIIAGFGWIMAKRNFIRFFIDDPMPFHIVNVKFGDVAIGRH